MPRLPAEGLGEPADPPGTAEAVGVAVVEGVAPVDSVAVGLGVGLPVRVAVEEVLALVVAVELLVLLLMLKHIVRKLINCGIGYTVQNNNLKEPREQQGKRTHLPIKENLTVRY